MQNKKEEKEVFKQTINVLGFEPVLFGIMMDTHTYTYTQPQIHQQTNVGIKYFMPVIVCLMNLFPSLLKSHLSENVPTVTE